ncbi:MAG: cation:dicarboxylase symporter family transporter [Steroidobacteraceae bacterium]
MSSGVVILLALCAGLLAGALLGHHPGDAGRHARGHRTLGALWLNGLRVTVLPLVFALLVTGVGTVRDSAAGGRVAARSIGWFVVLLAGSASLAALLVPLALRLVPVDPGAAAALRAGAGAAGVHVPAPPPLGQWLQGLVPSNVFESAAKGDLLQLVIFALLFGFAATRVAASRREPLLQFFQGVVDTMLVIVHWVLWLAPVGVFALAVELGRQGGLRSAGAVGHYLVLACGASCCILLASYALAAYARVPPSSFARAALPSQVLALGTRSSLACLTAMLEAARGPLRIPESVSAVTLPLAVSLFRATSPIVNLTVVLFVAHVQGVEIGLAPLVAGVLVATVTNFAIVSLPSQITFFTTTVPISIAMGVPTDILPLLLAVEFVSDLFRTVGNVSADLAVTALVARKA